MTRSTLSITRAANCPMVLAALFKSGLRPAGARILCAGSTADNRAVPRAAVAELSAAAESAPGASPAACVGKTDPVLDRDHLGADRDRPRPAPDPLPRLDLALPAR